MPRNTSSRRSFLTNTAKTGLALGLGAGLPNSLMAAGDHFSFSQSGAGLFTGFDQTALPYTYNALEPVIDAMTMELHYSKHAAAYAKNLKEAATAESVDMTKPLEATLSNISKYSPKLRNNGGGHFNHEMFWKTMKTGGATQPAAKTAAAITRDFNSFDAFKTQFSDAAKNRFGSGWAWLLVGPDKKLKVASTPNQDNPLMDIAEQKGVPILGLDVWEHAYYLKYQNRRPEYVENWWKLINWDVVEERLNAAS
jgi:Fe-Mn family superoxide dismutase